MRPEDAGGFSKPLRPALDSCGGVRAASEILADGLITLSEDHRINALDPMAEELLQWKSAEVAGKGFSQALGITDREGTRLPDASESADLVLLPPARRDPPILSFRRKDGSRVLCEVRTAQVRDDLGEVVEVVCALWRTTREGDLDRAFGNPLSRRVLNAAP